ncbi:MAG: pyridoxamine 5'-phosphate oxidase family protein [Acidobacteria bacterium]|nr:pyridoxamine 5'-phosphate oxidase family protein [Acidobacteriota bacterium]
MNELETALRKHRMWFGSYTRAGELKKVQVWCFPHDGNIEFLTARDSLKAKRASRNPHVICYIGSEDGPAVTGTAELITAARRSGGAIEFTGKFILPRCY